MISLLIQTLAISLTIQAFFFIFAATAKTDKFTDLSYGLTFILITIYLLIFHNQFSSAQILVASLIILWGTRLATYLFIRILKIKKDARFDDVREDFIKFAQFWLLQGISVWIIMVPNSIFLSSQQDFSITTTTILGSFIALLGLGIESIADWQKFTFKNQPQNKDKFIQSGIWKYSRHPNYFGEMTFWWGLFLATAPAFSGISWFSLIGPVFITILLLFISGIPPLEKKHQEKYGHMKSFQQYKQKTNKLIPLPKKYG